MYSNFDLSRRYLIIKNVLGIINHIKPNKAVKRPVLIDFLNLYNIKFVTLRIYLVWIEFQGSNSR